MHSLLGILDHTSPACLPNAFLEDKANAVDELSYERVTTAWGGHMRKRGEKPEETRGGTDS